MNPETRAHSIRDRITRLRALADSARTLATSAVDRGAHDRAMKMTIAADTADDRADHLEHVLRALTLEPRSWRE